MRDETLHGLQKTELDIAKQVFRICRENNLRCSLVGGSAIGAVRHGGFIPWDDDIDIGMPRADYEKFLELCKTELQPEYFLQCFGTEPNCAFIFAKVRRNGTLLPEEYSSHVDMHQGVWVDIFVYDEVSDDPKVRERDLRDLAFWRNLLIVKCGFHLPPDKQSPVQKAAYGVAKVVTAFLPKQMLVDKCQGIMRGHEGEGTAQIYPYAAAYAPEKELMPADIFDDLMDVEFEGETFSLFRNYDRYLGSIFDDYLQLPPEEDRHANHYLNEDDIVWEPQEE